MPAQGICLQLTHTGLAKASLPLSDVNDGVDALNSFRKAGPVYVPVNGVVALVYSGDVAISFEVGAIRKYIDGGHLTALFVLGTAFLTVLPGPAGPAGGDLSGTYPNPTVVDLTIAGEAQGSVLYFNGANWVQLSPGISGQFLRTSGPAANPGRATAAGSGDVVGPGASTDNALVRWDGLTGTLVKDSNVTLSNAGNMAFTGGTTLSVDNITQVTASNGVVVNTVRNYGKSATNPGGPAPADGDIYYNTALRMKMVYDGLRSKWLSVESTSFHFGRDGNIPDGVYFRAADGRVMSATIGWHTVWAGTVISLAYTRSDLDAATFDVAADGVSIATVASSATSGRDVTINADFSVDDVLAVRNQAGGNAMSNVVAYIRVRWRV